ncbi:MAG: STAS domain-containing protein [Georgfuchsia sp.]
MHKQESKTASSGEVRRLVIESDLTIYNAPEQKRALIAALDQAQVVELDLAQVGDIDSAGLQVLLLAKRESVSAKKEMRIVAHSSAVQELLDFLNVAGYFGDPLVIPAKGSA